MELVRRRLDVDVSVGDALRAVRGDDRPFALVGAWAGGGAVVGSSPVRVVEATADEDPFAVLELPAVPGPAGAFGGGWVGHLGFALARRLERLPPAPPRPVPTPEGTWSFYDHVLRLDPAGDWWFESIAEPERRAAVERRHDELAERLRSSPGRGGRPWRLDGMRPRPPGYAGHRAAVADCIRRIAEGELFQANLCLRLEGRIEGDPLDVFADAVPRLSPAHGAFVGRPGGALVSFSPELFLRRTGRRAWSAPIKGTAPRPDDDQQARRNAAALAASAKDGAENVMIVDLMRNDLGRVARYGGVTASVRPGLEPHPGLWHLVSRVEAELADGVGDPDLVRAAFPPGSVTGAPKIQALHVIAGLEATAREAYTGAIGYASPVAGLELNVAIRTFEVAGDRAWLGVGGGVVADSDPEAELREAIAKARPLLGALGATVPDAEPPRPSTAASGDPLAALPRLARRPDPAGGLLETIAVRDGQPVALDRHLERLAAAAATALPADLAGRLRAAASRAGAGVHRLRLVVAAGAVEVTCTPAPAGPAAIALRPLCVPGGLGEHKWADREPLAAVEGPGYLGLVVDADGDVLEATSASVWLLEDDLLITPPADGRLLPGVTRARILEAAAAGALRAGESRIDLERLRAADGILVTSAIRLAAAAALEGSAPSSAAAEAAQRLRALLLGRPMTPAGGAYSSPAALQP